MITYITLNEETCVSSPRSGPVSYVKQNQLHLDSYDPLRTCPGTYRSHRYLALVGLRRHTPSPYVRPLSARTRRPCILASRMLVQAYRSSPGLVERVRASSKRRRTA